MNQIPIDSIINKRVLVRVNYDLPNPESTARIQDSIETIKQLIAQGNSIVLISHLGRPEGIDEAMSLKQIIKPLQKLLKDAHVPPAHFIDQYAHEVIPPHARIVLLENTRFDPRERGNDEQQRERAQEYAKECDVYVDEAFAVSHRQEASNFTIKYYLPWARGLAHQHELKELDYIKNNPIRPYIAVMAGAKLETKIALIKHILSSADCVLLGGLICFPFYVSVHGTTSEYHLKVDPEHLALAQALLTEFGDRIKLPIDFIQDDPSTNPHDIGPKTIKLYQEYLQTAKTIFWNGPMGWYENTNYQTGTLAIGQALADSKAHTAIGGGDTGESLPQEIKDGIDYISMGGGATLKYLSE